MSPDEFLASLFLFFIAVVGVCSACLVLALIFWLSHALFYVCIALLFAVFCVGIWFYLSV